MWNYSLGKLIKWNGCDSFSPSTAWAGFSPVAKFVCRSLAAETPGSLAALPWLLPWFRGPSASQKKASCSHCCKKKHCSERRPEWGLGEITRRGKRAMSSSRAESPGCCSPGARARDRAGQHQAGAVVCTPWDVSIAWLPHSALVCVQRGPGTAAGPQHGSGATKEGVPALSLTQETQQQNVRISCLCQMRDVGQWTWKIWHDFIHGITKKRNKMQKQRCVLSPHQKQFRNHTQLYVSAMGKHFWADRAMAGGRSLGWEQGLCWLQHWNVPVLLLRALVGLQLTLLLHQDICPWHLHEEREITGANLFFIAQWITFTYEIYNLHHK